MKNHFKFLILLLCIAVYGCASRQKADEDMQSVADSAEKAFEALEISTSATSSNTPDAEIKTKPEVRSITNIDNKKQTKSEVWTDPDVREEGGWIISKGECAEINIPKDEAMRRALDDARNRAIQYAVGINISSASLLHQSTTRLTSFTNYVNVSSYGRIIEEKKPVWEEVEVSKDSAGLTVWNYRVTLKCKVQKEEGSPDPSFNVTVAMDKMKYKQGDEIRLSVTSTQDCYITVLNVFQTDEKVLVIFPNSYDSDNKLKANKVRMVPSPESGIAFKALLLPSEEESQELLWILATKEPVDFTAGLEKTSIYSYLPTPETAVKSIIKRLVIIPLNMRSQISDTILITK